MTPTVAVIAVAHNSAAPIEGWLEAIQAAGIRDRVELCVVDSGSSPEQRRALEERTANAVDTLVAIPNLGFGRACNVAAGRTSAPVLLFTNPDTRILSLPARLFDPDALAGTVVGAVNRMNGRDVPCGYAHLPTAAWEARQLLLGRFMDAYELTAQRPSWVLGAALAMGRTDFEEIGGFSPDFFLYFEDADLCARHRARGGTVEVDPAFVVEHAGQESSDAAGLDTLSRLSGRTFAARHGSRLQRLALYALLVAYYVPRRVAVVLVRGRLRAEARRTAAQVAIDLLRPARVLRRLGVPDARRFAR